MLTIDLKEDDIRAGLELLSERLTDLTPLMETIGDILLYSTGKRFEAGEAPDGTPWVPKSPTTIAQYQKSGDKVDFRPLFKSGTLSNNVFVSTGPDFVSIGSNLEYSAVMHFGAGQGAFGANKSGRPIPWGDIPARPYLGISDTDRLNILDAIEELLEDLASRQD